jgi:hypothetical protein
MKGDVIMRYKLVICLMLLVVDLFGVFLVHAEDNPKLVKDKLVKRGGAPSEDLWDEGDVKTYLALPYITSTAAGSSIPINEIASKLEAVQEIGGWQIGKDENHPFKLNRKSNDISFELRKKNVPVFHVNIYDCQSWNGACDKLFRYITSTVAMWNKIPEYYTIEKSDAIYVIARNGKKPQKWHFDLEKRFIIGVYSKVRQENSKSKENAIAQIDKVIREIDTIIEGKKGMK